MAPPAPLDLSKSYANSEEKATNTSSGQTSPSESRSDSFSSSSSPAAPSTPIEQDYPSGADAAKFVLVVGGLGYIGSHTTWELLKEGNNVIIVDNLGNAFKEVLDRLNELLEKNFDAASRPILQFYEADYRNKAAMKAILEKHKMKQGNKLQSSISGVIHFAAYKSVSESISTPLKYYANNVAGIVDFCTMLGQYNIKTLVFSSSATVYGELANKGGRLPEEYCTHETTEWMDASGQEQVTLGGCTGLTNPYGRTKWMCEAILSDLAYSDPEWNIFALRYFNPVGCDVSGRLGEDPRGTPTNLMPLVLKAMMNDTPYLSIFGTDWDTRDGTAIRDFIHVSDLAQGHVAALRSANKSSTRIGFKTYNLGTGTGHSVAEVVDAMEQASGRKIPTRKVGRREGDVAMCIAEPSKAAKELDWTPTRTLLDCCVDLCRFIGVNTVPTIAVSPC